MIRFAVNLVTRTCLSQLSIIVQISIIHSHPIAPIDLINSAVKGL